MLDQFKFSISYLFGIFYTRFTIKGEIINEYKLSLRDVTTLIIKVTLAFRLFSVLEEKCCFSLFCIEFQRVCNILN